MTALMRYGAIAAVAAALLAGCAQEGGMAQARPDALTEELIGPSAVIPANSSLTSETLTLHSADPKQGYFPEWGFLSSRPDDQ